MRSDESGMAGGCERTSAGEAPGGSGRTSAGEAPAGRLVAPWRQGLILVWKFLGRGRSRPAWGAMKMVGFPWDFSETPASWQRAAPALGQHTEEILSGLGYGREDIAKLREEGVIR